MQKSLKPNIWARIDTLATEQLCELIISELRDGNSAISEQVRDLLERVNSEIHIPETIDYRKFTDEQREIIARESKIREEVIWSIMK